MTKILLSASFAGALFVGVLACLRLGWRFGRQRLTREGESGQAGLGAVDAAIFGLVGLLIAFTFTGAASRFDQRRALITQHVNAISTAWLRMDLANNEARDALRALLRRYVDALLDLSRNAVDDQPGQAAMAQLTALQDQIWSRAIGAVREDPARLTMALLPPLNEMFDLASSRLQATRLHPPVAVYLMLGLLVLVSALMAGFGMAKAKTQSPLHVVGFAAVLALSVYLILDLEFPRLGLVRIDRFDEAVVELRATMK